MESEILVVSAIGVFIGAIIGYIISKKINPKKITKQSREIQKIIKDPDLLLEKLNANGKMLDVGDELKYSVVEEGGVKKLQVERIPPKEPLKEKTSKKKKKKVKKKSPGSKKNRDDERKN